MHPGIYSDCKHTRATSDACLVKRRDRARIKNTSGFYDSTRLMRASNWNSARATTDDVSRVHEHAQVREFPNVKEACSTAALLRTLRHRTPTSTVPMLRTLESRAIFASFVFENSEIFQGCIAAS